MPGPGATSGPRPGPSASTDPPASPDPKASIDERPGPPASPDPRASTDPRALIDQRPGPPPPGLAGWVDPTRFGDVRWFEEIDSTNRYLVEQARAGAAEGVVAVADHQSAGRGRLGRSWEAPAGSSLLTSVLLRPPAGFPINALHLLTVSVALAAADACRSEAGVDARLKWPNDLVVGGRKLAGVLAEADLDPGTGTAVVVGIGVNVNWPAELPADLAGVATALNHLTGHRTDRVTLLGRLLANLEDRYRAVISGEAGRRALASEYRRRCATIGLPVRVELPDETFTGTASDISDEGHLLVDVGMCLRTISAGDVVHLRHQTAG